MPPAMAAPLARSKFASDALQIRQTESMTGTSTNIPATVSSAAPAPLDLPVRSRHERVRA